MTDSKAPRNVVMSDFFAVKSTLASATQKRNSKSICACNICNDLLNQFSSFDFAAKSIYAYIQKVTQRKFFIYYRIRKDVLPKTLPPCTTIIRTVILHGWCVGECWGDAGHDTSMLADVVICNLLLLRSLTTRCRYEGENIVSSKNMTFLLLEIQKQWLESRAIFCHYFKLV